MSAFLFTFLETLLTKPTVQVKPKPVDWATVRIVVHGPKETPWYMGATAPNLDYEVPQVYARRTRGPATCLAPAS